MDNVDQLFGDYGSNVVREYTKTVYEGLSQISSSPVQASGCSTMQCPEYDSTMVKQAAMGAELVVVALGTGQTLESEGNDRRYLDLPGQQLQILQDAVFYGGCFYHGSDQWQKSRQLHI